MASLAMTGTIAYYTKSAGSDSSRNELIIRVSMTETIEQLIRRNICGGFYDIYENRACECRL